MSAVANRRILVVEDEFLIATVLCDQLQDADAVVVGPALTVREAMQLIREYSIEAAILDMNLNGQWSDSIAEELKTRRIPFVLTTGYGSNAHTMSFGMRVVAKPYSWEEVEAELAQAMLEQEAG